MFDPDVADAMMSRAAKIDSFKPWVDANYNFKDAKTVYPQMVGSRVLSYLAGEAENQNQ